MGPEECLTYQDLSDQSARAASVFRSAGLQRGDHIAILLENHPRYLEIVWGALLAGLYLTPLSSHTNVDEAAYIANDCQARLLIASAATSEVAAQLPPLVASCDTWLMLDGVVGGFTSYEGAAARASAVPPSPDEPVGDYMFYSSGSTGRPKGILRPLSGKTAHDGAWANPFLSKIFKVNKESVYLSPAPLYHGAPLGSIVGVTSLGGTAVVLRKFDASLALDAIERYRVTHSQWVPTMFIRMLRLAAAERSRYDLSSHRVAIHSAAPCPVQVKLAMMQWWGPILHEYYSGTENPGATYVGPDDWLTHQGTVGRPLGFTIHICGEDGTELPVGSTGRIYIERPVATFEYHGDVEKTRQSRHPDHPNWMTLDDVGYLDEDGFLYLTDRASFLIITGGVNVYPREVEDCLVQHPAVQDVAVIGVPNEEMGEEVKAIVEVADGFERTDALATELIDFARTRLPGPKRPRSVDFTENVPRLPSGKLATAEIRKRYWTPAVR